VHQYFLVFIAEEVFFIDSKELQD